MDWTRLRIYFEVSLAVILMIRILLLRLRSVRLILVFLLFPAIVAPIVFFHRAVIMDYRILWVAFQAFRWACLAGVIYTLLTAVFSKLPAIFRFSRMVWTAALGAAVVTALTQTRYSLAHVLDFLMINTFVLDKAVLTVVGFILLLVLGFVFWYPVKVSQNVAILSVGVAINLAVQITRVIVAHTWDGAGRGWVYSTLDVVWLACLVYWILFLSRHGETDRT